MWSVGFPCMAKLLSSTKYSLVLIGQSMVRERCGLLHYRGTQLTVTLFSKIVMEIQLICIALVQGIVLLNLQPFVFLFCTFLTDSSLPHKIKVD